MLVKKLGELNEGGFDHSCILDFSEPHCFSTLFVTENASHGGTRSTPHEKFSPKSLQKTNKCRCISLSRDAEMSISRSTPQEALTQDRKTLTAAVRPWLSGKNVWMVFKRGNSNSLLLSPPPYQFTFSKKCRQIQRPHTNATTTTTTTVLLSGGTSVQVLDLKFPCRHILLL